MRNALYTLFSMTGREWPVWLLLGVASITVLAVALATLTARLKARHYHAKHLRFYERLPTAFRRQTRTGGSTAVAAVQYQVEALLSSLPDDPVSTFMRWRLPRLVTVEPAAVDQQIALLVAEAEGCGSRLLDFAKVTSPLLGLAGTLLGLQHAFSLAGHGKAAVEAGIATALGATLAGICVAIAAFATLRFIADPALTAIERRLWEAEMHLRDGAARLQRPDAVPMVVGWDDEESVDQH